jgi:hypothetical protein
MYSTIYEFKTQLKEKALKIRTLKQSRKQDVRKRPLPEIESDIHSLKYNFRHNFIAYCELRGTEYDKIEHPNPNNPPDRIFIDKIKETWKKKIDNEIQTENVCRMSERSIPLPEGSSIRSCDCRIFD